MHVVLVEGESDAQTLWHVGVSALGVPGASTFRADWVAKLNGIKTVYLHIEPDKSGETFLQKTAESLLSGGYTGIVKTFSCAGQSGCKDPSDLYLKEGDNAGASLRAMLQKAEALNLSQAATPVQTDLTDPPVTLAMPKGWRATDDGIFRMNQENGDWRRASWTPVLITRTLPGLVSGDVKVELAFRRGGQWHALCCERGVLASSRRIVELSDRGLHVTSENAKDIVKFLSEMEFANIDAIPEVRRVTKHGWIDDTHFAPGVCDGYDVDIAGTSMPAIGKAKGDYNAWKEAMRPHRERALFRFILSTAFAAPLLKPLGQRIFMVYNWGDSMGGKTAGLYCALSVWGDPESTKATFNATQVGIERVAEFFNDLLLAINEKQVAGDKQEFLQKIVYMLSEGSGKLRGNRSGGLQASSTWRSVVLANGEESLSVSNSMTGISTRVLEIFGGPFPDREAAGQMYGVTARHHGYAGVDFVRHLIETDAGLIQDRYEKIREALRESAADHSVSYLSSVAVVCIADYLASLWVWNEEEAKAWMCAVAMGRQILGLLQSEKEADVNERAYQHVLDWVIANRDAFTDKYRTQRFGMLECEESMTGKMGPAHHVLIIPSKLEEELTRAKYSFKKTMKWLADNEHIDTEIWSGKVRFTIRRTCNGTRSSFVRLLLPTNKTSDGFTIVDDAELPF